MSQATAAGARMCRGTFFILEKMEGGEKVLGQNRKIQMDKTKGGEVPSKKNKFIGFMKKKNRF